MLSFSSGPNRAMGKKDARGVSNVAKNDPESYARWRRSVPFTDEQIDTAFAQWVAGMPNEFMRSKGQRYADYFKSTRRLSRAILRLLMAFLVKVCALCGKTALYRFGVEGRCKAHRMDNPAWVSAQRKAKETKASSIERGNMKFDQSDKGMRQLHQTAVAKRGKTFK